MEKGKRSLTKDISEEEEEENVLSKKSRKHIEPSYEMSTWKITQKALLLEGLKQYGFSNLDKIADLIQTKNTNEVRQFLENRRALLLKKYSKDRQVSNKPKKKTIIQNWYDTASVEVPSRHKRNDSSEIFAEMFLKAAKSEPHLKPKTDSDPDIAAIYQYFSDLLMGVLPADLRPTDSTVVLSLLQSLGNIICNVDFDLERAMYSNFKGNKGNGTLLAPMEFPDTSNNETEDPWKEYRLTDPNNIKIARKLCNAVQFLNPLHVPPKLMLNQHRVLKRH